MGVVTRSETLRPVANPCELCKVKEKMEGGENRLCKLCTEEEKMKSTAEDKTIYVQLRSDCRGIWYAIEEKEKSPDSEIRKKKKTKKMKKGDDYMKMGGNWRITKLDLPKLPPGYKKNVLRYSAIPFKSRIYLFGGLRFPARFMDPGVSDVLSFDVRLWEWHSSPPMSYPHDEPCAIASDDGQNIVLLDFQGVKTFVPHDNSSGSSGVSGGSGDSSGSSGSWGQDVSHGSIQKDKFFNFYLFSTFEEDNKKEAYVVLSFPFFLMKYDLQSKSLEYIQEDFGKWHGGGVVLFDHYLFCFGIPGGRRSGKPRSLYAFNLRNLKLHSKVRNLPKPDDKRFPEEDEYLSHQLACLLKINDSNDKLALIWSTMHCYSDGQTIQTMLRVMKFTIVKSETGKLFEACILSKGHCVVDGRFPISCLAMPIGQEGQGKPIDQEGQGRPIGQEGQGKKKQKRI